MKVLFVAGGNSAQFGVAPFISQQGQDLRDIGFEVSYFPIKGKGVLGYLRAIPKLRAHLQNADVNVVHAHYTLSGWVAVLARSGKPIVLSLMGTDAYGEYTGHNKIRFRSRYLTVLTYLIQPFVSQIISKSANIDKYVWCRPKASIIPNGIDLSKFFGQSDKQARDRRDSQTHKILFLGNPKDPRKNFQLVSDALQYLKTENFEIITPYPISHDAVVSHLHETDVLIVPSFMEGSPNLVKEAMACNCTTIATRVGDVEWLFGSTPGYYLTDFCPHDLAKQIDSAIHFSRSATTRCGRTRLIKLQLESKKVAAQIAQIYEKARSQRA